MYGGERLPEFLKWICEPSNIGADINVVDHCQEDMEVDAPVINLGFLEDMGNESFSRRSFLKWERIMHSHGCSMREVDWLRKGKIPRCVDMVIYPNDNDQCEILVKMAIKHNVMLVPYGGGTNVTQALMIDESEKRMIVSIDMARMNNIRWVDKENQMACVQAGILGVDLERDLK
jgi:alkyldihydroxyacetonephosphate synthase